MVLGRERFGKPSWHDIESCVSADQTALVQGVMLDESRVASRQSHRNNSLNTMQLCHCQRRYLADFFMAAAPRSLAAEGRRCRGQLLPLVVITLESRRR